MLVDADHRERCSACRWALVLALACGLLVGGCPSVQFTTAYQSDVRHDPLPLRATLNVVTDPALRKQWEEEDEKEQLELIRQGFQDALRKDLLDNGPLTPVGDRARARLVVTLKSAEYKEHRLWIMMWFLAPLWLFGVPMYKANVELGVDLRLTSLSGDVVFQGQERASCSMYQGVYYGHRDLTFGCPARQLGEALRDRVSMNRADILARVDQGAPLLAARPFPALEGSAGGAPIAVVFQIHDMTGQFEHRVMDQLTEYLATQVAQQLGFKVAPREQLRQRLAGVKTDSFKECYDRTCQIELGKALAANKTVSTSLIRVGDRCVFNATILDLKTEATDLAASADTGCDENSLLDGARNVVRELKSEGRF